VIPDPAALPDVHHSQRLGVTECGALTTEQTQDWADVSCPDCVIAESAKLDLEMVSKVNASADLLIKYLRGSNLVQFGGEALVPILMVAAVRLFERFEGEPKGLPVPRLLQMFSMVVQREIWRRSHLEAPPQ
jgi:hypothetical protein